MLFRRSVSGKKRKARWQHMYYRLWRGKANTRYLVSSLFIHAEQPSFLYFLPTFLSSFHSLFPPTFRFFLFSFSFLSRLLFHWLRLFFSCLILLILYLFLHVDCDKTTNKKTECTIKTPFIVLQSLFLWPKMTIFNGL